MSEPKFYAVRQARTKVIGSRPMTRAEADYEVKIWGDQIGPARVVPVDGPVLAAAVRDYDQEILVPLLYPDGTQPASTPSPSRPARATS